MANSQQETPNPMDRDSKFETQEEAQAKLHNVESDEIESRPAGQAPAFIMRLMLTSAIVFLLATGIEVVILHSIIGNPEVTLIRRVAVIAIGSALLGAAISMIVGLANVMKKEFEFKSSMTVMVVILVLWMIGIAILGDNPILNQYMN